MNYLERAKNIRLVSFDVDGVLTDGKLYFDENGREYKAFHARDGHGIKMLRQCGVEVAVISGRYSKSVEQRMNSLGVDLVFQGQQDKPAAVTIICSKLNLSVDQIAYVGDDLLDLPLMQRVGLAIAVKDAHYAVIERAHWVTEHCGGNGAARDVCDMVLDAQNELERIISSYL